MLLEFNIVWENGRATVPTLKITIEELSDFSKNIRKVSVTTLRDAILQAELAKVEKPTGRLGRAYDAVLQYPHFPTYYAIQFALKLKRQTAINYTSKLRRYVEENI